VPVWGSGAPRVSWNFEIFFFENNFFLCSWIFLMCWCQKWILKNEKKTLLWYIFKRKTLWKATSTILPNKSSILCKLQESHGLPCGTCLWDKQMIALVLSMTQVVGKDQVHVLLTSKSLSTSSHVNATYQEHLVIRLHGKKDFRWLEVVFTPFNFGIGKDINIWRI
jgi:hypothetical protein